MIQGTGSDVGKSLLVAGLARAFARRGLAVRPFKAQNISNNSAVTADTPPGEIGRAQALQARACKVPPSLHMNPVLLKPQAGVGSQVVLQGRVIGRCKARDYPLMRDQLMPGVLDSLARLGREADLILVEGAGSPVEMHLRAADIVNMALANAADLPVLLLGDIDRGGVLAALIGTHALLTPAERGRVKGYLINKFRGDLALFEPACEIITRQTGWPCQGVVRWHAGAADFPAEDTQALVRPPAGEAPVRIVVPRLPHLANFDDIDPLRAEPEVALRWIDPGRPLPRDADVILLPGSKATLSDLRALRDQGWDLDIQAHVRQGGRVVGVCGGYQMLGHVVRDPEGIEGPPGAVPGLGLLDLDTTIGPSKTLLALDAVDETSGCRVTGYEMHMGVTGGGGLERPWLRLLSSGGAPRPEGAVSADGRVRGSYVHGLFASAEFRAHWLASLGAAAVLADQAVRLEIALETWADHLEVCLDLDAFLALSRPMALG
ncbi:cobyric acid synthase [Pararhodospirillum photometricum]|nr:cobyric acid synthase [Pararhodospirillum photometricum]